MANVLPSSKQSVDLAATGAVRSRIRRDPPPPVKEVSVVDVEERETRTIVLGVITFALALFVIVMAVSNAAGWSPSQVTIHLKQSP